MEDVANDIINYSRDDWVIDEYQQAIDDANLIFNFRLEGQEEGYESGKIDREIEIARNMLKENIALETIIKCMGLTKIEIEKVFNQSKFEIWK